jgi:hypothetical protein
VQRVASLAIFSPQYGQGSKSSSAADFEGSCNSVSCSDSGVPEDSDGGDEPAGAGEIGSLDTGALFSPNENCGSTEPADDAEGEETGAATASNVPLHVGHLTFLPNNSSGTRSFRLHEGQSTMVAITMLSQSACDADH